MKKTMIGGEALIEGVMMRGPENIAIAVRKPDGEIVVEKKPYKPLTRRNRFWGMPVVRGAAGIIETMVLGIRSLMRSADFAGEEEDENYKPSKFEVWLEEKLGDRFKDVAIYVSLIIALSFSIGLFVLLPNVIASFFHFNKNTTGGVVSFNLVEGAIRMALFLTYLWAVSKMPDIKRVFMYHGAEHKTIHCYEHELPMTVENARTFTTRHPRCGTAFLFLVMVVSILVFSLSGWHNMLINILFRLALMPLVAGISYELIRFAGRSDGLLMKIVSAPGLALQRFTTYEPDDDQLEVAIVALKSVLVEGADDRW